MTLVPEQSENQNDTASSQTAVSDEASRSDHSGEHMDLNSLTMYPMTNMESSDVPDSSPLAEQSTNQPNSDSTASASTERSGPSLLLNQMPPVQQTEQVPSLGAHVEARYRRAGEHGNDIINTMTSCFKPFFLVLRGRMRSIKDSTQQTPSPSSQGNDAWEISIDSRRNNLEQIGSGVEGIVYRGRLNGQVVACKRVNTREQTNIKHLSRLNHINIIRFIGVSVGGPFFYIVMDYCPHGSLYDVLKKRREANSSTQFTEVLDWSKQVANGVEYLHSNKIVHRDLKSPNILVAENFILKISDFGTSKELSNDSSRVMSFNGTTSWMAPEVIRNEPCSGKVDVWSYGVMVWEMLTCAVPYQNSEATAVMWGVGKGTWSLPIPSSAPEVLKALMTKCWYQLPADRPSFKQIISHLEGLTEENADLTRAWSIEVDDQLPSLPPTENLTVTSQTTGEEVNRRGAEESEQVALNLAESEQRMREALTLFQEVKARLNEVEERERVAEEKERRLDLLHHGSPISNDERGRATSSMSDAREETMQFMGRDSVKYGTYSRVQKNRLGKKPRVRAVKSLVLLSSATNTKNSDGSDAKKNLRRNKSFSQRSTITKDNSKASRASSLFCIDNPDEDTSDTESELEVSADANPITASQISLELPRVKSCSRAPMNNDSDPNSTEFFIDGTKTENGEQ